MYVLYVVSCQRDDLTHTLSLSIWVPSFNLVPVYLLESGSPLVHPRVHERLVVFKALHEKRLIRELCAFAFCTIVMADDSEPKLPLATLFRGISADGVLSAEEKGRLKDLVVSGQADEARAQLADAHAKAGIDKDMLPPPATLLQRQVSDDASRSLARRHMQEQHLPYEKMGKVNPSPSSSLGSPLDTKPVAATALTTSAAHDLWVVTEKIHGANMCFVCDGHTVSTASRKRILPQSEDFFGSNSTGLVGRHLPTVLALVAEVRKYVPADVVWVYGELFGGGYPGLVAEPSSVMVQGGLFYSNRLHFVAFDVAWAKRSDTNVRHYLPFKFAMTLCRAAGILESQILMEGTQEECMNYNPHFDTLVPPRFGLPRIPKGAESNPSEGIVVRPANIEEIVSHDDERGQRQLVKIKAQNFQEKTNGAKGNSLKRQKKKTLLDQLWLEARKRTNGRRVESAVSKAGPILLKSSTKEQQAAVRAQIEALVKEDLVEELSSMGLEKLSLAEAKELWGRVKTALQPIIASRAEREKD